jgi:arylsulfatase A-like enzyme/Flp pilus assembly protein TadD
MDLRRWLPTLTLLALPVLAQGTPGDAGVAPTPVGEVEPPNVLLITVDTLRPDALGWVAGRNPTPALDELARQGFRFPGAVSPAPVTQPAHISLFTGLVPRRHGIRDNGRVLGPGSATLAEALRRHGYRTAAFVSGYPLAAEFGLDRGFDHYDDELGSGPGGSPERPAAATAAAAREWLAGAGAGPWLVWVHFWDPHDPYTPPADFSRGRDGPRGAYHGEVAYVDHTVGELRRGIAGRVLTVFAADHGESLGEHGEQTHGFFIYDSTVAVPLVFHLPGRLAPGESHAAARLVDVAPTILDLLGLPPLAADTDGVSLAPLLAGKTMEVPPALIETRRPWLSYGWSPLEALRRGTWKLIAAPRPELYDLAEDPGETVNLVRQERAKARELRDLLSAARETPAADSRSLDDPEALARLRSLGYVGAGSDPGEPPAGVADPKDRVELWNELSAALAAMERGQPAAAVAAFDAVLEKEPGNPFALSRSGAALLAAGRPAAAVPRLRRAAEIQPDDAETRYALATALTRSGDYAAAAQEWLEVVRLHPRRAEGWINLAVTLGRSGRGGEAIEALAHAVELAPERVDLRLQLVMAHHAGGDAGAAKAALRDALAAFPDLRPRIEADPFLSRLLE